MFRQQHRYNREPDCLFHIPWKVRSYHGGDSSVGDSSSNSAHSHGCCARCWDYLATNYKMDRQL